MGGPMLPSPMKPIFAMRLSSQNWLSTLWEAEG